MYPHLSKAAMCGLFGYTRQAWYDAKIRLSQTQLSEVLLLGEVKKVRQDHPRMGCEKLLEKLRPFIEVHGIKLGRDKFYDLLREHGLLVKHSKRKAKTTNSNHLYKRFPNIVRDLKLIKAGQLWVSDITYVRTLYGFVYLSLVTDAYSKKIVGWSLWQDLSSTGALNALRMATETEKISNTLIHHSDRGIQYCCYDYVNLLKGNNIGISMTENGDPYENAVAERVNGILKSEYDLYNTFEDYNQAHEAVKVAIDKYNNHRPHRSCDMLTPAQAHLKQGILKKHWKKRSPVTTRDIEIQN